MIAEETKNYEETEKLKTQLRSFILRKHNIKDKILEYLSNNHYIQSKSECKKFVSQLKLEN